MQTELVTDDATPLMPVEELEKQGQQQQGEEEGWAEARKRYEGEEQDPVAPSGADALGAPSAAEDNDDAGDAPAVPAQPPQATPPPQAPADDRFARLEQENAAMRQQIAALMGGQPPQQRPQALAAAPQAGMATVPESIRAEAKEFAAKYPDMGMLVTEDSAAGELVRRKLEEYGVDEAYVAAIPIAEARRVAVQGQQAMESVQRQNYWNAVSTAHPDVIQAINSGKGGQLYSELQRWANTKPYAEGKRLMELMQRDNDAVGTNEVLTAWKRDMSAALQAQKKSATPGKPSHEQRSAMAAAIGAVPSGAPSTPRTKGNVADERAQWAAAKRRWG